MRKMTEDHEKDSKEYEDERVVCLLFPVGLYSQLCSLCVCVCVCLLNYVSCLAFLLPYVLILCVFYVLCVSPALVRNKLYIRDVKLDFFP